jgi:DNA repair exonuclease SbcCD ATPase subunit
MRAPRFAGIWLSYGCHEGKHLFPEASRPVVIAGPNGSGKSTLLEAVLRTMYGFRRQSPRERTLLEHLTPWSGAQLAASVDLVSASGEVLSVHRDFTSDDVKVRDSAGGEIFHGDGNPGSGSRAYKEYRTMLEEWLGFGNLDPYRRTAWIGQGELVDTALSEELLRLSTGGHRRVKSARDALKESYHELTRKPIDRGQAAKRSDRRMEELHSELKDLEDRLDREQRAMAGRQPLVERGRELEAAIGQLDEEIARMEAALEPLAERRAVEVESREALRELQRLEAAARELDGATRELERAEEAWSALGQGALSYPTDFEGRLSALDVLWEQESKLGERLSERAQALDPRTTGSVGVIMAAAAFVAAGAAATALGFQVVGIAGIVLGFLLAAVGGLTLWQSWQQRDEARQRESGIEQERSELRERIADTLRGVPAADDIRPETADEHRQRFGRQTEVGARRDAARTELASTLARLESTHAVVGPRAVEDDGRHGGQETSPVARGEGDEVEDRALRLRQHLEVESSEVRRSLAASTYRLEANASAGEQLPEGMAAESGAVEEGLRQHRVSRENLREELTHLNRELGDAERGVEAVLRLEERREQLRLEVETVEADVLIHRLAWSLLGDAHREFRERDQDRLVESISTRLEALSSGDLGPLVAQRSLEDASVRMYDKMLPLDSPPLSFGEKHLLHFAIRLGAADFLAEELVRHPLLVDEPFTHLDETRARHVWDTLCAIASERQVIVTTQDRLVLDHLGVRPDIALTGPSEWRVGVDPEGETALRPDSSQAPEPGQQTGLLADLD